MSKSREELVALIEAQKASLAFTRSRIAKAKADNNKTRVKSLESGERYTLMELERLARVVAEMDSASPYYPEGATA